MSGVHFYDEVFEKGFCRFLLANSRKALTEGHEFTRSNFQWDARIRQSSAVVLVRDIGAVVGSLILDALEKRTMISHRDYCVMNYAWTRLSHIPWHDDSRWEEAITIYLNETWEPDWGGLFLYREQQGEIRGYSPVFNSGLKNLGKVSHSTTPVMMDAPEPRFTLQLFTARTKPA